MECKRATKQHFKIRVRIVDVGSVTLHDRLRFMLLTSRWVPKPAGMLLWSALHVLLIVGTVALRVVLYLCLLAAAVYLDIQLFASFVLHLVFGGPVLLICSLLRLSRELMRERERARQIRVACGSFVEWWKSMLTPREHIQGDVLPCGYLWTPVWTWYVLSNTVLLILLLHKEVYCSWCEEVVHMHDAISI